MPITSRKGMIRMSEQALGARFPAKLQRALLRAEDDTAVEKIGIHWATQQVLDLLDHNVRGVHFYTLNHSRATLQDIRIAGRQVIRCTEKINFLSDFEPIWAIFP